MAEANARAEVEFERILAQVRNGDSLKDLRDVVLLLPPGFRFALAAPRLLQLIAKVEDDDGLLALLAGGRFIRF